MTTTDIHWIDLHQLENVLGFQFKPSRYIAVKDPALVDEFYNYRGYEKAVAMLEYTVDGYKCFAFESDHDAFMMYLKYK